MPDIPADLWILLAGAVFAGGVGAFAWLGGNARTASFARTLAAAARGAAVDGDAAVIEHRGLSFRVRQVREGIGRRRSREILQVDVAVPCPAWFSLLEQDRVLARVAGDERRGFELPGYRWDSASPAWVQSWLHQGRVRTALSALAAQSVSLLRLGPDGVECRRPLGEREMASPEPVVRALVDALHGVVTTATDHRPELATAAERATDYQDTSRPLTLPFVVLAVAALAVLPAIGFTHGRPPLPFGMELELAGALLTVTVGLAAYRPRLKAAVRGRENAPGLELSGLLLMGTGLLLVGVAVSRPLAYLFV